MKVGLQLYTIRDQMQEDMDSALKSVKQAGYDYVEFAGFFGKSSAQVNQLLQKHQLQCVSVHQVYEDFLGENAQKNVDFLREIGVKYCAIPWMAKQKLHGTPEYAKTVEEITSVANLLAKNGIALLYHNHDFEFEKTSGGDYKLDVLLGDIQELKTQIDVCWVHYAGVNPAEYILKYKGRSPIVHLKDYSGTRQQAAVYGLIGTEQEQGQAAEQFAFRPLGMGVVDIAAAVHAAHAAGAQYLVVEQDKSDDMPPIKAVEISRNYLKKLGY